MIDPDNFTGNYILHRGKPVSEPNLLVWAKWFEKHDRRIIYDNFGECYISTVFLGLDHGWWGKEPILYETMVFGGPNDQYQERYATRQEAKRGHRRVRRLLRKNRDLSA